MQRMMFSGVDHARAHIGREVGVSDWLTVDQARISGFAGVTGDAQWIHVDEDRARRESPYGATIAHGFLTLSLLAKFATDCVATEGVRLVLNYGLNRVRFVSPVKAGSRVRGRFVLSAVDDIPDGAQLTWDAVVEIEGEPKPACVAEMLIRWYF